MTNKTEMKLFTVCTCMWKLFFHFTAIYVSFKYNFGLGLIMLFGIVLHNSLTLIVFRGKIIKTKIVNK